jgi:hypothetical protein
MQDQPDDDVKPGTGLYCFLNAERECGPDCMAFLPVPIEGPDYATPDGKRHQWAACMLLVHSHKLSKHLVLIANMARAAEAKNQPQPTAPFIPVVPK